ncbi:thiol-disulfide oxidoreductase DCC family protein [Sulfitobacter aestuariivivens]|uniref:DUF393 domain-containing protein n=1 Tax=Sulfitobacter aestuariivivens TaxID=2766981 RepID=A0A927D511_9RHOB|nr:DUF393 domain-containing protein [Sulfitobacter aestuariivivens]MBD3663959.1 DUF393 domain-containing protein [Sulfitobacter aestuariivivens]
MADTEVLYNDSCPVCRREVHHYARLSTAAGLPIAYDDLGNPDRLQQWGLTPDEAARRLHVRKDAKTYAGIPAFIVLWREIPRYRWLARLVNTPGIRQLAILTYDHVLAPLLFHWHKRRQARQKSGRE